MALVWSTNSLVYGGTAQLLLVRLLEAGSSLAAAVLAVIAINGPPLAAGRDLVHDLAGEHRRVCIVAALLLVVPAWSVARATQHVDATSRQRARHYLGVALAMFVGWQIATTTGMVLAGAIALPANRVLKFGRGCSPWAGGSKRLWGCVAAPIRSWRC